MLNWSDPVENIHGLGPRRSEFLHRQGFDIVGDLLLRAPLRFIDRRDSPPFNELHKTHGSEVTAIGTIESVGEKGRYNKRRLMAIIGDGSGGYVTAVWFKRYSYLIPRLKPGIKVAFSGRVGFFDGPQIAHPNVTFLDNQLDSNPQTGLIPVYPSGEEWNRIGFTRQYWSKLIVNILKEWDGEGPYIPEEVRDYGKLVPLSNAIRGLHIPETTEEYDHGIAALKFAELFQHQLLMVALRRRRRQQGGIILDAGEYCRKLIKLLPFELSNGQKSVLKEIRDDFQSGRPMHRLLQGEVGSGKTVVAFVAAAIAADGGKQTAIMAPTELLARQHYENALKWLEPAGIKPVLIVAGRHPEEINRALYEASIGGADVIIGTHAIFQERVKPAKLGLVIIDEQQRFGVQQRARLISKGVRPHVLLMTATPIPRTLALAHYGDLDLSELHQREGVERHVKTRVVNDSSRDDVFKWLRDMLKRGERGYLVYPVIDQGPAGLEAAQFRFEQYSKIDFKNNPIALMHGRQPVEERIRTMEAFRRGDVKLLMATAVVEVGVDVPEATLMIIENSERFGLAQLHQLRGRVGRKGDKAFCILLTPDLSDSPGFDRLKKLETSDDAFSLAEEDLRLRGSGEPLGARQSGMVKFKLADLATDMKLLKRAHKAAEWLLERHPKLEPFPELRAKLRQDYRSGPRTLLSG